MTCKPHAPIAHTAWQPPRRNPDGLLPSVVCGKCWRPIHPFLDVLAGLDDAAIRRHRKRGHGRMRGIRRKR